MVVQETSLSGVHDCFSSEDRQINDLPLTQGVTDFVWGTWASLAVSERDAVCENSLF
eukprot:COSAG06_NODE_911_length_11587_cov_2.115164_11_plen_57_part_00